jgi:hypothetical protein
VPDGDKEVLTYAEMKKIIVVALDKTASAVEQRPAVEPSPVEPQGDSLHQQEELIEAMTRPPGGAAALASVGSDDLLAVAEFVDATGGGCGDGLPECGTGGGGNAAAQQEEGEKGSREEDLAQ